MNLAAEWSAGLLMPDTTTCPRGQVVIGQTNSIPPSYICGPDPSAPHDAFDPVPPTVPVASPPSATLPPVIAHPLAVVQSVVPASWSEPGLLGLPLWAWGALAVGVLWMARR